MNRTIIGLAATLALVGGSQASVIVDNFESYSSVGDDMNGKGGWTVTNGAPFSGSDPVVILHDYTWDASAQSATVGGIKPLVAALTSLSHSASVELVSTSGVPTSFKFEAAYTESDSFFPNRNNFQFVLGSTAGNLLTIDLTPGDPGVYDVAWSNGFGGSGILGTLSANTSTQFQLDTWWNGSAVAYNLSNAGDPIVTNGVLTGASQFAVINNFSAIWDSTSGGGFGNGYVTIDNVSLVPEPSAALLGLLGATFAFSRRRRA